MIAIIDYGMGNLRSVQKALEKVGAGTKLTQDPQDILLAEKVILPGVGAMKPAMERLGELGFIPAIADVVRRDKPFLGICLGFQLFFEQSDEGGLVKGLGIVKGTVDRFQQLKVPQIGWNRLKFTQKDCPLFQDIPDGSYVYFCHSYFANPEDKTVIATSTNYGIDFTSSIRKGNLFGVQFHPEKSQNVGLKILENFVKLSP